MRPPLHYLFHLAKPCGCLLLILSCGFWFSATAQAAPKPTIEATCLVQSTADAGSGTLRQCLLNAKAGDTIRFDATTFPVGTPKTIMLTTPLPELTVDNLTIDANNRGVIIDGSGLTRSDGLVINGANGVTIWGLTVTNFTRAGIVLTNGAANCNIGAIGNAVNRIANNTESGILLQSVGTTENHIVNNEIRFNGESGILMRNGATQNHIQQNLISGNGNSGVTITGSGTLSNTVSGNHIGVDAAGVVAQGNGGQGININDGAQYTVVGGEADIDRNIISGNWGDAIAITGRNSNYNRVIGNYIGTNIMGSVVISPADINADGIYVAGGASFNIIGSPAEGSGNVVNGADLGIMIWGNGTSNNIVIGNLVGVDATGTIALGNRQDGISIGDGATLNTIGGPTPGERNIVSANGDDGIIIQDPGSDHNRILGNFVGTDRTGTVALPNVEVGIRLIGSSSGEGGPSFNEIGGEAPGAGNLISGNGLNGIQIRDVGTTDNRVVNNLIGTDVTGTKALPNSQNGVRIEQGATDNIIGGTSASLRNIISGNTLNGIVMNDAGTSRNQVIGNYIGLDITGNQQLANGNNGIFLFGGVSKNKVGMEVENSRNVVSGNGNYGIVIEGANTTENLIQGNFIGTDVSGTIAIGNNSSGIYLNAPNNRILGNLLSGNKETGIWLTGSEANNNRITGNQIGTNVAATAALGNYWSGIFLTDGATNNTIGGSAIEERNLISGNGTLGSAQNGAGIWLTGETTTRNRVIGNFIGTDKTGTEAIGNTRYGIVLDKGTNTNFLGSETENEQNVISGNGFYGIIAQGATTSGNHIQGNYIGTDLSGTKSMPNKDAGVVLYLAKNNVIGRASTDVANDLLTTPLDNPSNLISGNGIAGVWLEGADENQVAGNYIGTDQSGEIALGNGSAGVLLIYTATNNLIGGLQPGLANVISGNSDTGVKIAFAGTTGNRVVGNWIGTDHTGLHPLGNGQFGVYFWSDSHNNSIGIDNTIAYNGDTGIRIEGAGTLGNQITRNRVFANTITQIEWITATFPSGTQTTVTLLDYNYANHTVRGTACANCLVELYANPSAQQAGTYFLGAAQADGSGKFILQLDSTPPVHYLTALQTAPDGSTSGFSPTFQIVGYDLYLPAIANGRPVISADVVPTIAPLHATTTPLAIPNVNLAGTGAEQESARPYVTKKDPNRAP